MHMNRASAHVDRLPARNLLHVERRATGDEQIYVELRGLVNQLVLRRSRTARIRLASSI
jgi:hypothetical protein